MTLRGKPSAKAELPQEPAVLWLTGASRAALKYMAGFVLAPPVAFEVKRSHYDGNRLPSRCFQTQMIAATPRGTEA
jgi:hypothetical protein